MRLINIIAYPRNFLLTVKFLEEFSFDLNLILDCISSQLIPQIVMNIENIVQPYISTLRHDSIIIFKLVAD